MVRSAKRTLSKVTQICHTRQISTSQKRSINRKHRLIEQKVAEALLLAKECGKELLAVKESLNHGEFMPWVKANFDGSYETACRYKRVYESWHLYENVVEKTGQTKRTTIRGFEDVIRHTRLKRSKRVFKMIGPNQVPCTGMSRPKPDDLKEIDKLTKFLGKEIAEAMLRSLDLRDLWEMHHRLIWQETKLFVQWTQDNDFKTYIATFVGDPDPVLKLPPREVVEEVSKDDDDQWETRKVQECVPPKAVEPKVVKVRKRDARHTRDSKARQNGEGRRRTKRDKGRGRQNRRTRSSQAGGPDRV